MTCPSGLHGEVWCTCPGPVQLRPLAQRRLGTCHQCQRPFDQTEALVTVFQAPRFNGLNLILHRACAIEYLKTTKD